MVVFLLFFRAVHHPEFPSVLTALEIDHAVVANCLIDVRSIETILLIKVRLYAPYRSLKKTIFSSYGAYTIPSLIVSLTDKRGREGYFLFLFAPLREVRPLMAP